MTPLAQGFLVFIAWLFVLAAVPRAFGAHPVVITGGSMLPAIDRGDIVIVRTAGPTAYKPGAVVTFADPNHPGLLITHRVQSVRADGRLVTRGDANNVPDSQPVSPVDVRGRAVLRVPYIGRPVVWAQQRAWLRLAVASAVLGVVVIIAAWPAGARHSRRRAAGSSHRSTDARSARTEPAHHRG